MTDTKTPYGTIHWGGDCRDDYPNFVTYDTGGGNTVITLQRPAMRALWAAQVRYAKRVGWSEKRLEENPRGRPIQMLVGTNRTCATQWRLYREDSKRYAHPNTTLHTRGLALDVSQAQPNLEIIYRALASEGWKRVRPDDEPWHWSYWISA